MRRIALGATDVATILLGLGALWWVYALFHARTTLPFGDPKYLTAGEGLPFPWQMPFAVWAIPCAVAALALLISGILLQRPREYARASADLSALGLIASASAGLGMWLGPALAMGDIGESLFGVWVMGLPFWPIVIYGWRLRSALWRRSVVDACGGQVAADEHAARRWRQLQAALVMLAAMAAGVVAAISSMEWG